MIKSIWICLVFISQSLLAQNIVLNDEFKQLDLVGPIPTAYEIKSTNAYQMLEYAQFEPSLFKQSLSPNAEVYWYRIDLSANQLTQKKELALVTQNHLLQHFDIFLFDQDNLIATKQLGIHDRPVSDTYYQGVVFTFPIQPNDNLTLLLRKESDGPAIMPLSLMNEEAYQAHQVKILFFWGGAIGVFFALALYNGFIFSLNQQNPQYAWYMLFQFFMFLQFAPLQGFGYLIFPDTICRWLAAHIGVLHQLMLWCALMFGYYFLDIKTYRPKIGWFIEKCIWVMPVLLLVSFQLTELQRIYVNSPIIIIATYLCISSAIVALKKRYSPAGYYLLSWLCIFTGAFCGYLTYINIIPQNIVTLHSFMIGVIAELFLISISLAKRLQYQERQESEYRLIDQTLNMPNLNYYQYALDDYFLSKGFSKSKMTLILVNMEGVEHVTSSLGTRIVAFETKSLLKNIGENMLALPWHVTLELNKNYFGVFVPPQQVMVFVTDDEVVEKQIEMLRDIWHSQLSKSLYLSDIRVRLSSAKATSDDEDLSELHQKAYMALLEAQRREYKWLAYDEQMTENVNTHIELLHDLKLAISQGQLDVYVQPQMSLDTNEIVGVEALMRWSHPERGMVPPNVFIPIAEQSGLINKLTRLALEKLFIWIKSRHLCINVSLNISVFDLQEPDFVEFLDAVSNKYRVDTSKVTLEITESQELDYSAEFLRRISDIKALGFTISVDDFGTGYSSMAHLSQLNIDEVKIDMFFVHQIQSNVTNQTIVKTLVNMAEALDASVVVEGIETQDELDIIKLLGGHIGQGYYWSPAISMKDFEIRYLSTKLSVERYEHATD